MLETQNYTRNPFDVEAVRVTSANIEQIAAWCGGEIQKTGKARFILVPVRKPANDRQTKAYTGDFVVFDGNGFKVYMPRAFNSTFSKNSDAVNLRPTSLDQPELDLEVVAVVDPSQADALLERAGVVKKVTPAPVNKAGVTPPYLQPSHPGDMPGVSEEQPAAKTD